MAKSSSSSKTETRPSAPLTPTRFEKLARDVQKLFHAGESAATSERVGAYWRIGERIQRERLAQSAGYHNSVLRDLAADTRISLRTLQHTVLFHAAYSRPPTTPLGWTHYRALLTLPTAAARARFEKLAVAERLSARQLTALIRAELTATDTATLERPTEPSYVYAANVHSIIDADTLLLDIDLGFEVYRRQRIRLALLDAPDHDTPEGRKATDFVTKCLLPAKSLVVQTRRSDVHGRYVGHVFYSPLVLTIDECFLEGRYLNDEIIAAGHARLWA